MPNINDLIPRLTRNPITGKVEEVAIDDAFDPLFNRRVKATIQNRYGVSPLLTPLYGYADFLDTVFAPKEDGKWGIMGPAMGILGGFGRTLDKAEDFLLGGITEGVNSLNQVNPFSTAPTTPQNLIHNIFVEDQDYTGEKLFAAMGNSMNKLAGGTVLDETDFEDTTWKPAAFATELITDPGIAGGIISKAGTAGAPILQQLSKNGTINSPVKKVGDLLSSYDDIVTKGAWDVTVPGLRPAIKSHLNKMRQFLAVNSEKAMYNVPLKSYMDGSDSRKLVDIPDEEIIAKEYFNAQERWANAVKNSGINDADPSQMPEILAQLEKELGDIDVIVRKHGLADSEYESQITELVNAINDAKAVIANPQDYIQGPPMAPIVDRINEIVDFKNLGKLDVERGTQATADIQEALKRSGIASGDSNTDSFRINSKPKVDGYINTKLDEKYVNSHSSYFEGVWDKFWKDLVGENDDIFNNPGHEVKIILGRDRSVYGKINAVLEGNYFDDAQLSKIAKDKMKSALDEFISFGGHKVAFSYSKYYNAMSDFGANAVNRIKKDMSSVNFKKLYSFMEEQEKALQLSDAAHKKYASKLKTIQDYEKLLSKSDLVPGEYYNFLKKSEEFYNYLEYAKARYGYLGYAEEKRLKEIMDSLDDNVHLGIYGYGTNLKNKTGRIKETANAWNTMLNTYYEDPWLDEFGNLDFSKYITSKEYLMKNKLIDLMINPSETFDMATIIKNSPKYKGLENMSIEDINKDLNNLYELSLIKMNYGINPTSTSKYLSSDYANVQKYKTFINTYMKDNPNYDYLIKGIDDLKPYQQDFLRKMSKDFNLSHTTYRNMRFHTFGMANYGNFAKKGLTLNGSEVDQFILNTATTPKPVDNLYKYMNDVQRVKAEDVLTTLNDADFSKYIFESANINTDTLKDVLKQKVMEAGYDEASANDLFTLINKQLLEPTKISRGDYATLRNKEVQSLLGDLQDIGKKYGIYTEDWEALKPADKLKRLKEYYKHTEMYFAYRDALNDDIVTKNSFLNELLSSRGMIAGVFNKKQNLADFQAAEKALIHNISIVNKQFKESMPLIKLVENEVGDGKVVLGYAFNHKNLNAVKDFSKLKINPDQLQDVVFSRANQVRADEIKAAFDASGAKFTFDDLDNLFDKSQNISRDLSRKIGYTDFSDNYFRHSMSSNKNAEKWLSSYVYAGYNTNDLADLSNAIMNYQNLGHGKAYGILPVTRSLRGSIETWNNLSPGTYIFSVDPYTVAKKTYSEGIFNNANFQTHVGLFTNDNFRISNYARSVQDLKDILLVKSNGELTGNMDNMILAAPKYSKEGRIIGFTQYDKFTDTGLQQALDNPETVLLPTHLMAPLDKMLRKDMKMSSKVYQFINKYFTIPIKYGTLTNLGFLVGNMGDAYFKQAVTMSKKYGTSVSYETARVADSIKNVFVLGNKFENTFEKYVSDMKLAMGEDKWIKFYSTTDSLISTPKARNNFEDWLKKSLASGRISRNEMDVSNLWLFLNNKENTSIFKGDFQNLGDLAKSTSKYAPPKNLAERLLTGDKVMINPDEVKEYWGLFAGNPVTEGILEASGNIESIARSASILNDLTRHYGSKDIYKILGNPETFEKEFKELNIKSLDALNVMSTANFDYNYMNDLTDRFATFVPFPTFVVKNYAYWMDIMVNEPELIDSILTMQDVAWRGKNTDKDKFQAEAKGRGAIPLSTSKNSKLKGIFKPTPTQSMFSAFDVMQNPVQNIAFRTNPILHPLTHHLQKAEDDKYRPYSTDPYQKNIKRTDPEYNALKATFHRLNPYERTINTWLRTPSKLFSEHNAQASDFVPSVFQPDFSTKSNTKNKKR